jgi:non-specific serine/threonine protein kinase
VPITDVFDGTTWHAAAPLPQAREYLAAASDGRALYAVGGRIPGEATCVGIFQRYDPATDTWTTLPDVLTHRGGLGAVMVKGELVAVGGDLPDPIFDKVEAYNPATGTCRTMAPLTVSRHGMAVVAVGSSIYAIAGDTGPDLAGALATGEVLDVG